MPWGTWRTGSKETGSIKVGVLKGSPALITNWGGRKYGVMLTLDGAGNTIRDEFTKNLRVSGDAVIDSGASVLRIKGDGISIKESNVEVAKFGATTTVKDINLTGKIVINSTGSQNVMMGVWAGTDPDVSGVDNNVCLGVEAGRSMVDGSDNNICIGTNAGYSLTISPDNVMIGKDAGYGHAAGKGGGPTALGDNIFIGRDAGYYCDDGFDNIYIGDSAGKGTNESGNTPSDNIAIGDEVMFVETDGNKNIAIGKRAMYASQGGDNNISIGYTSGASIVDATYNILLGYKVDVSAPDVTREIVIGSSVGGLTGQGTQTMVWGQDFQNDYVVNDFGEGNTLTHGCDERIKKDINDNDLGLSFIDKLRTVTFKKRHASEYPEEIRPDDADEQEQRTNPDKIYYGFIAQEVKAAMDEVGHSDFTVWRDRPNGIQHLGEADLITPLVKAVQELSEKLDSIDTRLTNLEVA